MKFRVNRSVFAAAAAWASKSAGPQDTPQGGMLMQVVAGQLVVSAYNAALTTKFALKAEILDEGEILVPATVVSQISNNLPAELVEVYVDGEFVRLESGTAKFRVPTIALENYAHAPKRPAVVGVVNGAAFRTALSQVLSAAGKDASEAHFLHSVRVEFDGDRIILVATDKHRLSVRDVAWKPADPGMKREIMVPRAAIDLAATSFAKDKEVTITLSEPTGVESLIGFSTTEKALVARRSDGDYPKYRQLLPGSYPILATVNSAVLSSAVKRAGIMTGGSSALVLTFTEGAIRLRSTSEGLIGGEYDETLECEYTGEEFTTAVRPSFMADAIAAARSETVTLGMIDEKKPIVVSDSTTLSEDEEMQVGTEFRYVVMPVKLANVSL